MIVADAGEFNRKIEIYREAITKDGDGYMVRSKEVILSPYAKVKTTKGFTLIANGSDFEKAYTNFTIRYPKTAIDRKMLIAYKRKTYTIEYLNNVDEASVLLEIQAKEVTH